MFKVSALALAGLLLLLCAACPGRGGGGIGGSARQDPRLPADWPLPALRLPASARVFEGQVNPGASAPDGRTVDQYAAFFECEDDWAGVQSFVEKRLAPLGYRVVDLPPEATPLGGGPLALKAVYASNDGFYLVTLMYELLPQSAEQSGLPQSFFTLMIEQRSEALPPSADWPEL